MQVSATLAAVFVVALVGAATLAALFFARVRALERERARWRERECELNADVAGLGQRLADLERRYGGIESLEVEYARVQADVVRQRTEIERERLEFERDCEVERLGILHERQVAVLHSGQDLEVRHATLKAEIACLEAERDAAIAVHAVESDMRRAEIRLLQAEIDRLKAGQTGDADGAGE